MEIDVGRGRIFSSSLLTSWLLGNEGPGETWMTELKIRIYIRTSPDDLINSNYRRCNIFILCLVYWINFWNPCIYRKYMLHTWHIYLLIYNHRDIISSNYTLNKSVLPGTNIGPVLFLVCIYHTNDTAIFLSENCWKKDCLDNEYILLILSIIWV